MFPCIDRALFLDFMYCTTTAREPFFLFLFLYRRAFFLIQCFSLVQTLLAVPHEGGESLFAVLPPVGLLPLSSLYRRHVVDRRYAGGVYDPR